MTDSLSLYADAILVMTSLGAALFCLRLQGRLQKLQRLDQGVGAAVKQLTEATQKSQEAVDDIRGQVGSLMEDLDERYARVKVRRQEIDDALDSMDGQIGLQVRRCQEARQLTEQALTPLVRKAEVEIHALTKALELSSRLAGVTGAGDDDPLTAGLAEAAARRPRRSAREDAHSNPFLRAVGE